MQADDRRGGRVAAFGPVCALAAAALFGVSTPLAKVLVGAVPPVLLAGLLYLGSGIGLGVWWLGRSMLGLDGTEARLRRSDLPWLAGAVVAGGVCGPVLLMFGLTASSGSGASLLLNMEGVLTSALALLVFREHLSRRIIAGMLVITAGGVVLSCGEGAGPAPIRSSLLVSAACLAWALDNNLTRRISAADPVQIACIKGLVAGAVNVLIALALGAGWPTIGRVSAAGGLGLAGYGLSLTLFVLALRHLGAARTGACFGTAPFVGAVAAVLLLREPVSPHLLAAAALMGAGVWLHLTERHEHWHVHGGLLHEHRHAHDRHHGHEHREGDEAGREPHSHLHAHAPLAHKHAHYPDTHHDHGHSR